MATDRIKREKETELLRLSETTLNMLFACVILHKHFQISPLCASESDSNAMYLYEKKKNLTKQILFQELN